MAMAPCLTSEVRKTWDQVWFCVSSTALDGEWLEPLLAAIGMRLSFPSNPGWRISGVSQIAWVRTGW